MGKYFKTSDEFYKVILPFFEKLLDSNEGDSRLSAFEGTLQLSVTQPDANIILDCRESQKKVICGESDLEGDILLKTRGDTAHILLLGNLVLRDASMAREIIVRGPLEKLKELSSIFMASSELYKQHLLQMGYRKHLKS